MCPSQSHSAERINWRSISQSVSQSGGDGAIDRAFMGKFPLASLDRLRRNGDRDRQIFHDSAAAVARRQ